MVLKQFPTYVKQQFTIFFSLTFLTDGLKVQVGTKAPVNYSARGMGKRGAYRIHACEPFKEETWVKNKCLVHNYPTVLLQIKRPTIIVCFCSLINKLTL